MTPSTDSHLRIFDAEGLEPVWEPATPRLALYGSLRKDFQTHDAPLGLLGMLGMRQAAERCWIAGQLYDLGDYPGIVAGEGTVLGDLYTVEDPRALHLLDSYERWNPGDPSGSLYVRRRVILLMPEVDAWVYFYNGDISEREFIPSGDWAAHRRRPCA